MKLRFDCSLMVLGQSSEQKTSVRTISFNFRSLSLSSLKLLADAHLVNTSIMLTRELVVPNSGAGGVLYNKPIRFKQPGTTTPTSFTTFFRFSVSNLNPGSIGGGLAFVISPGDEDAGNAGGYMGIPTGAIAVEFDTLLDVEWWTFTSSFDDNPKEFSYKELKLATKFFDLTRVIGHGAFGTVYRGVLSDSGEIIVVKRCSHTGGQGMAEFLSELSIIGTLRHRNLVRLQGWCHKKGELLQVIDLMLNGTFDKALFESRMTLTWVYRSKILMGVASALA